MRKLTLVGLLFLAGCLQTTTHKIPMKRQPGDIWWRDNTAVVRSDSTAAIATPSQCDDQYFEDKTVRWPDDWQQRHPQPPRQKPSGQLSPPDSPDSPEGQLY